MKRSAGRIPRLEARISKGTIAPSDLISMLRGNPRHRLLVSNIRPQLDQTQYPKIVLTLCNNKHYERDSIGVPFPGSLHHLKQQLPLASVGLQKELIWASARLEQYSVQLAAYIEHKRSLVEAIATQDFVDVNRLLQDFEQLFGFSMFTIRMRLLNAHGIGGSRAKREYLRFIYDAEGLNGYVYFLAYYISRVVDPDVGDQEATAGIASIRGSSSRSSSLRAYLKHHLLEHIDFTEEELDGLLREEGISSLIDLYEAFVKVIQVLIATDRAAVVPHQVIEAIARLETRLRDFRLTRALETLVRAPVTLGPAQKRYIAVLGKALRGEVKGPFPSSVCQLSKDGTGSALVQVLAEARNADPNISLNGLPPAYQDFVVSLARVYAQNQYDESVQACKRIVRRSRFLKGAEFLTHHMLTAMQPASRENVTATWKWAALNCEQALPEHVLLFSPLEQKNRVLEEIAQDDPAIAAYFDLLTSSQIGGGKHLPGQELDACVIQVATIRHDLAKGVQSELKPLQYSRLGLGRTLECASVMSLACLAVGQQKAERAAELLVGMFLLSEDAAHKFHIKAIIEQIDVKPTPIPAGRLTRPIAFSIYSKKVAADKDRRLAFTYNDFLRAHGCRRPSELASKLHEFDRKEFVYFLMHVCVSEVMDQFSAFASTRELGQERIWVLQTASRLDESLSAQCLEEIKSLTRKLFIYDGLKRVEQSKIYVDLDNVRRSLQGKTSSAFDRLAALSASSEVLERALDIQNRRLSVSREIDADFSSSFSFPQEDRYSLLAKIIAGIWTEFLTVSEYSLDVYLSVRIRHGTLAGRLRIPLEELRLVTQLFNGNYRPNLFWAQDLAAVGANASEITDCLARFSEAVDQYIRTLSTSALRIRQTANEQGLFEFFLTSEFIDETNKWLTPETRLDQLIDRVFDHLLGLLQRNLLRVQALFDHTVPQHFISLLQSLYFAVAKLGAPESLLRAIQSAQTEMMTACQKVSTWFRLSKTNAFVAFHLDIAIEIAAESVRNYFGRDSLSTHVTSMRDVPLIPGKYLLGLVDMFFILFENARTRSGLAGVRVDISIQRSGNLLTLQLSNQIAETVDRVTLNKRVLDVRNAYQRELATELVASEGGSGFAKLRKILAADLACLSDFDVYLEGDRFTVLIALDMSTWR
jgi:hypothetical protein